jgi:hypothetical protein
VETGELERTEVLHPTNELPGELFRWLVPFAGQDTARRLISLIASAAVPRAEAAS